MIPINKASNEALEKVARYFSIAFILMIFVMLIHFKSGWQTAIVVMMIPFAMLGVFWGHGIHDKPVSIMSLWGMVALTGVVINDAIVFLSKYDSLLLDGLKAVDAVVEAGKVRLRPIILTSLTTTIGLFPLILSKSVQAQFLIPLAVSIGFGVLLGSLIIVLSVPAIFVAQSKLFRTYRAEVESDEIQQSVSRRPGPRAPSSGDAIARPAPLARF